MAALPLIAAVGSLVGGIATVATALTSGGGKKQTLRQPTATPRSNSVVADALARRRGSSTNQVTGASGAESATSGKKTLLGT